MKIKLFITAFMIAIMSCSFFAFADGTPIADAPYLTNIAFDNAEIDGGFNSTKTIFDLKLDDNSKTPTVSSYEMEGEGNIFINYIYDVSNHQTGIMVTLKFDSGSIYYTFNYSNTEAYTINDNANLADLICEYGEIYPTINTTDTSYKLYIPSDLTELTITPITDDVNAYCASQDVILAEGQETKLSFTVTASNGEVKVYEFSVKRVDKTLAEVKEEMRQPDFVSFLDTERFYETTEFYIGLIIMAAGIIVILLLLLITKRLRISIYDKDEQEFYKTEETETKE